MPTLTVKKRLVSVGRDYAVHDETGTTVFTIDGKVRFARTFDVKDRSGQVLYAVKEKLMALDQTFLIHAPGAAEIAVRRTTTASVYPMKFDVVIDGETKMHAQGSFFRDGIAITRGSERVATVSREPNTVVEENFEVWTADAEDPALMLALTMVIVEGAPSRGAIA